MQRKKLICNQFSGINRTGAIFNSSAITASDMQNVELYSTEINSGVGIRTAEGNVGIGQIPEGEIVINIYESVQRASKYFFVYAESSTEGKIYLFSPENGDIELKVSGLSVTGKSSATDISQGWSDLWVFSNGEEILSVEIIEDGADEVTMMDLTDMDGRNVKGLGLVVYSGRLWIFNGQTLWYSVQENIFDFSTSDAELVTSAGYIEFVKNITAIYPYLGSLAVFHKESSSLIVQESEGVFAKSFEFPGGCAGADSLVFHGTQLYFYDDTKKGVFSFIQVVNGDKTLGENIALDIQKELFSISANKVQYIKALSVITADRNEVWFLLPTDSEEFSIIMIYDYLRRAWVKRKSQKINCMNVIDGKLYSAGRKIYEEYVSSEFDGQFIDAFYKCTPLNLGEENSLKILAIPPKISVDMNYGNNFYIEYTKNYDSLTTKVRQVVSKTLKNVLYFDKSSWDKTEFPNDKVSAVKRLPSAYFRTLQMSFYALEAGQNFCIKNIEFGKIKVKS